MLCCSFYIDFHDFRHVKSDETSVLSGKLTGSCQGGKSLLTRLFFSESTPSYYYSLCVQSPLVHPYRSTFHGAKERKELPGALHSSPLSLPGRGGLNIGIKTVQRWFFFCFFCKLKNAVSNTLLRYFMVLNYTTQNVLFSPLSSQWSHTHAHTHYTLPINVFFYFFAKSTKAFIKHFAPSTSSLYELLLSISSSHQRKSK